MRCPFGFAQTHRQMARCTWSDRDSRPLCHHKLETPMRLTATNNGHDSYPPPGFHASSFSASATAGHRPSSAHRDSVLHWRNACTHLPNRTIQRMMQSRPTILLRAPSTACQGGVDLGSQALRLSSCPLLASLRRRSSFLRLDTPPPLPALDITTGRWSGLLRGLSDVPAALAAACLSHMSLLFTHMSSICSCT